MKTTLSVIITLVLLVISSQETNAQKLNPDDIIGKWYTDDKGAIVQIYKKNNDRYYGKFLWLIDEKDENGNLVKDKKNSDKKLRNRTIKEMEFILGFTYNDRTYEDGVIYNPKDGNRYSATMKLASINTLEVRGYLLFEWLGKTVVWTREK
jgi:uncharacterized protein (DUF2147 family)